MVGHMGEIPILAVCSHFLGPIRPVNTMTVKDNELPLKVVNARTDNEKRRDVICSVFEDQEWLDIGVLINQDGSTETTVRHICSMP